MDRNVDASLLKASKTVALRKESVDRNITNELLTALKTIVALRKESVDRNRRRGVCHSHARQSLSARRAWIEMGGQRHAAYQYRCRSPQGERG